MYDLSDIVILTCSPFYCLCHAFFCNRPESADDSMSLIPGGGMKEGYPTGRHLLMANFSPIDEMVESVGYFVSNALSEHNSTLEGLMSASF